MAHSAAQPLTPPPPPCAATSAALPLRPQAAAAVSLQLSFTNSLISGGDTPPTPDSFCGGGPQVTASVWAAVLLTAGVWLHPALKLLYAEGKDYGKAKNTVSVVDAGAAAVLLGLLLQLSALRRRRRSRGGGDVCPGITAAVWGATAAPGLFVFGSIALATWANYESYWTFAALAPLEVVFVVVLSRLWQRASPSRGQVVAVLFVLLGAALLASTELDKARGSAPSSASRPPDGWPIAVLASVAFRLNQASATIAIRGACVRLQERAGVLEIAFCKMTWVCLFCVPYAFATEGVSAWRTLSAARGSAAGYMALSVAITCVFQTAQVGLNSHLRSVTATVVTQLQPAMSVALALLLSGTTLGSKLKLHWDGSAASVAGILALFAGSLFYLAATHFGRPPPTPTTVRWAPAASPGARRVL